MKEPEGSYYNLPLSELLNTSDYKIMLILSNLGLKFYLAICHLTMNSL